MSYGYVRMYYNMFVHCQYFIKVNHQYIVNQLCLFRYYSASIHNKFATLINNLLAHIAWKGRLTRELDTTRKVNIYKLTWILREKALFVFLFFYPLLITGRKQYRRFVRKGIPILYANRFEIRSPRKHGKNFTRLAVINFLICRGMFICHPTLCRQFPT